MGPDFYQDAKLNKQCGKEACKASGQTEDHLLCVETLVAAF